MLIQNWWQTIFNQTINFINENKQLLQLKSEQQVKHYMQLRVGQNNKNIKINFQFQKNQQNNEISPTLIFKSNIKHVLHLKKLLKDLQIFEKCKFVIKENILTVDLIDSYILENLQKLFDLLDDIMSDQNSLNIKLQLKNTVDELLQKKSLSFYQIMMEGFGVYLNYQGNQNFGNLIHLLLQKIIDLEFSFLQDTESSSFQISFKEINNLNEFLKSCGIFDLFKKLLSIEDYLFKIKIFKTSLGQIFQSINFFDNLSIQFQINGYDLSLNFECVQKMNQITPILKDEDPKSEEYNDITNEQDKKYVQIKQNQDQTINIKQIKEKQKELLQEQFDQGVLITQTDTEDYKKQTRFYDNQQNQSIIKIQANARGYIVRQNIKNQQQGNQNQLQIDNLQIEN